MRIANQSQRAFDLYLAAGMTLMLGTQAFLIMGGVTKLLPLTGVTMPFLSYGGSSLLVSCLMAGLLMFLSASEAAPEESP
jgi:cell division protein FtsW